MSRKQMSGGIEIFPSKVVSAAQLPAFVPYDLRHPIASLLLSSNVPLLYVSKQLGHAKPTITLDHYAKWLPSGE